MPTLTVNQIEMYYEIAGEGEPLLLLHGLGSSSRDWEKQVPHFVDHYQVITCDLRGHGQTSKPRGPYSMAQFAGDVSALLTELGLASVHLAGISMGGMVAFEMAICSPNLLKSLTIINSYPQTRIETFKDRLLVWRRFLLLDLLGVQRMGAVLAGNLFPGQDDLQAQFVERWAENDKRAYRESLRAIVGWDVEDRIHEIVCPVLIIASDQDYFPLEEKQAYARKMRNVQLMVIEDARHAVTAEKPEQFNRVLDEFLNSLE